MLHKIQGDGWVWMSDSEQWYTCSISTKTGIKMKKEERTIINPGNENRKDCTENQHALQIWMFPDMIHLASELNMKERKKYGLSPIKTSN